MGTIAYNTTQVALNAIYTTTGGGTVFSANLAASTAFNYFSNTAVVNDAIYFGTSQSASCSNLYLNIGTALAGTGITIVWEYYCGTTGTWRTMHNLTDGSNGFTTTGAVIVKFPLQAKHVLNTVNGITTNRWIRARISALTSITNGGAQSTTTVKTSDGIVRITAYSDASPCTWDAVYTWVAANAPEVGATKIAFDTYKFDNCFINIANGSTLRSTGEKIYMGNGSHGSLVNVSGLYSGTKVGTNGWSNASSYFFCYTSSTNIIGAGTTTRVYGGVWEWFTNIVDGITCAPSGSYLGLTAGEWRGVYMRSSGYFAIATADRCTFDGGLITASAITSYPTNMQISNPSTYIWQMYGVGNTISGVVYGLPATSLNNIVAAYNGTGGQQYNFVNPSPAFPSMGDTVKPITRSMGSLGVTSNCYFYTAASTTFTDYTAQAQSATASDVPLYGAVGDCLYIKTAITNTNYQPAITFTLPTQTNDWGYAWEYWNGTAWIALTEGTDKFDLTNNLSQTGVVYLGTYANYASTTVNGVAGWWIRLRITSVGTGTPMASMIQTRIQAGIGDWKMNELYNYDLKVNSSSGTAISGATVYIKNGLGTVIGTLTTDASGNITQQQLQKRYWFFDKTVSETLYNIGERDVSPYLIRVRRYGYQFQDLSKSVSGVSSDVAVLQTNTAVVAAEATALAYTGITIDPVLQKITLTSDHTMREVYDYTQAWACVSGNMGTAEFLKTSDGASFSCTYDIVVNNCTLSGSGTISMPTKTFTTIGTGATSLIVVDSTGTKVNISLTGLVPGSRVQLYDVAGATELYNAVVSGSTLTFPYTWTADKTIRYRVMYVSGATAKKWVEATATVTNTGMSVNVVQTDDTIYNAIGVDGSTVTECSITGTALIINVNSPTNTIAAQRLYSYEVYWLSTPGGIRDQDLYIDAQDITHFVFLGGLKIKNLNTSAPLSITGANITPYTGNVTDVFDLTNGASIGLNFNRVEGFAYAAPSNLTIGTFLGLK